MDHKKVGVAEEEAEEANVHLLSLVDQYNMRLYWKRHYVKTEEVVVGPEEVEEAEDNKLNHHV